MLILIAGCGGGGGNGTGGGDLPPPLGPPDGSYTGLFWLERHDGNGSNETIDGGTATFTLVSGTAVVQFRGINYSGQASLTRDDVGWASQWIGGGTIAFTCNAGTFTHAASIAIQPVAPGGPYSLNLTWPHQNAQFFARSDTMDLTNRATASGSD